MTYGLKEGYWLVNGTKAYVQLILGKWHYFIVLRGWKRLMGNEKLEKI